VAHLTGAKLYGALLSTLKAAGCIQPGIPDLQILRPMGRYAGLWIELKTSVGHLHGQQSAWLKTLNDSGYYATVAYGSAQAIEIIKKYLEAGR